MNNEEKEYLMKFAERLKSVRLKNHVTQEILAEKLNVSVQLISKWENGKSSPSFYSICKMSDIFKVSLDYLAGISDIENMSDNDNIYQQLTEIKEYLSVMEFKTEIPHTGIENSRFNKALGLFGNVDIKSFFQIP